MQGNRVVDKNQIERMSKEGGKEELVEGQIKLRATWGSHMETQYSRNCLWYIHIWGWSKCNCHIMWRQSPNWTSLFHQMKLPALGMSYIYSRFWPKRPLGGGHYNNLKIIYGYFIFMIFLLLWIEIQTPEFSDGHR